ncbi:MAG: VOC family protein [bacterium]|nr:VOC family protein [bacterium]
MISGLHSAVVKLRDFEVGVRDYTRLLGQAPHRIESDVRRGTRSVLFALANMTLELRSGLEGAVVPEGAKSGDERFGQVGIRLVCEDDDPSALLAARGVRIASSTDEEGVSEGALSIRRWRSHRIDARSSRGLPVELICGEVFEPDATGGTAGSAVEPAARIRALDHVVVMSPDPVATRAFYGDGLGIRLALDRSFEERGVRLLFFRVGGTTIEIGGRLGSEARPDRSDRLGGLAWQVVEIDAIRARLVGEGFDVSKIREGNKPGTRVCTVRDPVHEVPTLLIEPPS